MSFADALTAMEQGLKVRLPDWKGYWKVVEDSWGRPQIMVFTKDGQILNTPHTHYMFEDTWELAV